MLTLGLIAFFLAIAALLIAFEPEEERQRRPSLNLRDLEVSPVSLLRKGDRKKDFALFFLNNIAFILKPLIGSEMRHRLVKDLGIAQSHMTPEVFLLLKFMIMGILFFLLPGLFPKDMFVFVVLMSIAVGYFLPDVIIKNKIAKVKDDIIRHLPDTVDLLGLCVNAGLDFMMSLKWVVSKSSPTAIVLEMDNILQEISVGKPRREALRDMARKYEIPDLSTFSRTLIQADKMGTSVSEALNMLSEDMRMARFRRGEAMALKAPLKMLVPLLFCIFPVVFILVGAPIFLDFVLNNPMKGLH